MGRVAIFRFFSSSMQALLASTDTRKPRRLSGRTWRRLFSRAGTEAKTEKIS